MRARPTILLPICAGLALLGASARAAAEPPDPALRGWVQEMKTSPRGPFERIRWFCQDGTVHPPRPYACQERGGGVQHGEWNERTRTLRGLGFRIGNVLAALGPEPFLGPEPDLDQLDQLLIERFLMRIDDGWIFRGAKSYRGALQVEDEETSAQRLVLALLDDPAWLGPARFWRLREAVRLLPLPHADEASAARVRHQALVLAEKDSAFTPLRAKIHNLPDAGDAARVRRYAQQQAPAGLRAQYGALAAEIDALYSAGAAAAALRSAAAAAPASAPALLRSAEPLERAQAPAERLALLGQALLELRDGLHTDHPPEARLALLRTSLRLEDEAFTTGTALLLGVDGASRRQRLDWLRDSAAALYGAGFLGRVQLEGVRAAHERLAAQPALTVDGYRAELHYLALVPEWCGRWLEFHLGEAVARLSRIEPLAHLMNQDRLRGSPLLLYSRVIDGLSLDANRLAGIQHDLFGSRMGSGLRALNPGLARGVLVAPAGGGAPASGFRLDGVYLVPESTSDLPRVSGILTRGEGSSLSHVQLLARNLGIPNVVVGEEHVPAVQQRSGEEVVMAVSPRGVVQLARAGPEWDTVLGAGAPQEHLAIRPDLEKLDLTPAMIPLRQLRGRDSGRLSGPKGANLGELKHHFGDSVPDGFVISFGVFRQLLEQPLEAGGPSVFAWMKAEYAALRGLQGAAAEARARAFLGRLRGWIETAELSRGFRDGLRMALDRLGPEGSFGVFVRSDTNVEDLPGFTGAGLNLTVPNVVGYDAVLGAVRRVWASPFTERAYGWRQSNMETPEYVFPAVVVQKSFPSEKSGVLVTVDVDTGDPAWLSVAVNEGVGGAVEGQAAEALRIHAVTGEVRFLARATAPLRPTLDPRGGIAQKRASGAERVLREREIERLRAFAQDVGRRFPSLQADNGAILPADVEFAFREGKLYLLQIRPFVESDAARKNAYLIGLDAAFRERGGSRVSLDGIPEGT